MPETCQDPRRVEYLPLSELTPDPRNPKAHDLSTIDASIGRFGMLDTIVLDGRTGHIISGHGRREALAQMEARGETPPEGVKVSDSGEWLVPAVTGWSSRTDTEAHAALIALNRTTELGGWVDEELLGLLDELSESGDADAFSGVGFGESDIDDLKRVLASRELAFSHLHPGQEQDADGDGDEGDPDDDDGEVGDLQLLDGEDRVEVTVIVEREDRPALYALLKDAPFVLNVRDKRGA